MTHSDILSILTNELGIGSVSGFCVGYSIKKIAKTISLIICFNFVIIQYFVHKDIVTINYIALEAWSNNLLGGASVIHEFFGSLFTMEPIGVGFVGGLVLGLKKG